MPRARLRPLAAEVARVHPQVDDPAAHIAEHGVLVDGQLVRNPRSLVREGSRIELHVGTQLRGEAKLRAALSKFELDVGGRVALDVGAAAGGFTRVLLDAGAARVYAVDAGYGQLLGSLRQEPRVVVLERVNLGDLDTNLVPEPVALITIDLSYLALAEAVPQLEAVEIAEGADLIALVKPMFELGLSTPPTAEPELEDAVARAEAALDAGGWRVQGSIRSPVAGARGAVEFLVHATRER
jgi:23S rRNA (cytidine1920-2'-O)/16S rRNA (cytidine1409-2'-O)-methyltransferase